MTHGAIAGDIPVSSPRPPCTATSASPLSEVQPPVPPHRSQRGVELVSTDAPGPRAACARSGSRKALFKARAAQHLGKLLWLQEGSGQWSQVDGFGTTEPGISAERFSNKSVFLPYPGAVSPCPRLPMEHRLASLEHLGCGVLSGMQ